MSVTLSEVENSVMRFYSNSKKEMVMDVKGKAASEVNLTVNTCS